MNEEQQFFYHLRLALIIGLLIGVVAGLLTLVFGEAAGPGEVAIAGASAVITTLLLGYKPLLHRWVSATVATALVTKSWLCLIAW